MGSSNDRHLRHDTSRVTIEVVDDGTAVSHADAPTAVVSPSATDGVVPSPPTMSKPPARVDRYAMGAKLGAGGLGVVYEAWDPELQRRVAVKLVRTRGRVGRKLRGAERFLREAQALARLSHPNVVGVYGVGTCEDGETVYVVMEHIDGRTLRAWNDERRRTVEDIVRVFLAAGRGLVAAHEAGIVHRDFKPDNVMVDRRGRVRVLDFGLALVGGPGTHSDAAEPTDFVDAGEGSFDDRLTEVGMVMGTPAFMAPEQHAGQPVSPASDQYAFCVAMLSLLRGGVPVFEGRGAAPLAKAKARRAVKPAPAGDATPAWIEAVLLRGLEPEPGKRWPSMAALLEALQRGPRRVPRVVQAGVLLAALGGLYALVRPETHACADGAHRLAEAWSATRRPEILNSLGTQGRGVWVAQRVTERFDADVDAWSEAFVSTCEARDAGGLDDVAFDRRMSCLRSRAGQRERLLDAIERRPDPADWVPEALAALDAVDDCIDEGRLHAADARAPLPVDPRARETVEAVRAELADVDTMIRDGAFDTAERTLDAQMSAAMALGFAPLFVDVRLSQGRLAVERGDLRHAAEVFEDALAAAEACGHDYAGASAASELVYVYAQLRQLEDAERMLAHARAIVERAGSPTRLRHNLGAAAMSLYTRQQRYAEALEAAEVAMPDAPPQTDGERFRHSITLNNLALVNLRIGDNRRAEALLLEALSLREGVLGKDHPKLGTVHLNVSKAMARNGDFAQAEEHASRAVLLSSGYGEDHLSVGRAHIARGVIRKKMGRFEEARVDYARALDVARKVERPAIEAMVLANIGNLEKRVGNLDAAMRFHAEALAMREATLGPASLDVAASLGDIGALHRRLGEFDKAWQHLDRELQIKLDVVGKDHPKVVATRLRRANLALDQEDEARAQPEVAEALRVVGMHDMTDVSAAGVFAAQGRMQAMMGQHDEAISTYRESIRRHEAGTGNPGVLGGLRFELARSLWTQGRHGEARDSLSRARVELREGGAGVADELEDLERVAASWSGPSPSRGAP